MNMVSSSLQEEADVLCPKLMSQCWPDFYIHYIDIIEFDIVHDIRPSGRSRWLCFKIHVQMRFNICYLNSVKRRINLEMFSSLCLCLKIDVQMLNLVLHLLHWFCKKYKNQWIQICKHAYDDVQPSEWSRQKELILNAFLLLYSVHS